MADGTVRCWGDNSRGQIGNGTIDTPFKPVTVIGLR
jgi:Regulator of chromosome condensation (RCC1) repeat